MGLRGGLCVGRGLFCFNGAMIVMSELVHSHEGSFHGQGDDHRDVIAAEQVGLVALTPACQSLLRRHDLLLPLLQAIVADEQLASVDLAGDAAEEARRQWLQGRPFEPTQQWMWEERGWRPEDFAWQIERQSRLQALARERFSAKAEARYLQRKGHLDQVVYSLLRTGNPDLARELYLRVSAGEATFAELAKQYSEGPERFSQGLVGPKPLAAAHPALAERLRTARDGVVMEPFAIGDIWLVARREQLQSRPFDAAMADRMALELLQESILQEARQRLMLCNGQLAAIPPSVPASEQVVP